MTFDALSTGEMLLVITEGADRTTGVDLIPINRNRVGSPSEAKTTIKRGATGGSIDGATTLKTMRTGSTGRHGSEVGASGGQNEYILKPDTKYVVSMTTYADVVASIHLDWYEHANVGYKMNVRTQ